MIQIIKNLNYFQMINDSINIISYSLIILGLMLIFNDSIIRVIKNIKRQNRFKTNINKQVRNPVSKHIKTLTSIVYGSNNPKYEYGFWITSIFSLIFIFLLTFKQVKIEFALIFSISIASIPYLYLQIKLRNIRVSGSYEAEELLAELINQYKLNYYNMSESIDKSLSYLNDCPYTKTILSRLSYALKDYKSEDALQDALYDFVYAIDTEWIMMLSNNIYLAINDGYIVVNALEDILNELKDSKIALENSKRENNEGVSIMLILIPSLYLGSIFLATNYFNFTISKFFNYQFRTELGFSYFIIIAILSILNITLITFYKRRKFDI